MEELLKRMEKIVVMFHDEGRPELAKTTGQFVGAFKDCRNELCDACGEYKYAHMGACDNCKWKH